MSETRDAGRAPEIQAGAGFGEDAAADTDYARALFAGGGEMGDRMRALDWSQTPLGSSDRWPQSLRSAISICLGSRFPIAIYWGPELTLLYNDMWSSIPGDKHPWALGRSAHEVWPEIWESIGPLFEKVLSTGEATYSEDALLPMHRHGYTEECYFNFTFSPVRGEHGRVDGVFNAVIETTFRVISERRTRVLRELGERLASIRTAAEACEVTATILGTATHDVPFVPCTFTVKTNRLCTWGPARASLVADPPRRTPSSLLPDPLRCGLLLKSGRPARLRS